MLIEIMKKIFTISVLFLLAFIFSPKTTSAQGTYSCLWVTTSIGCVPKGVSCEEGSIPACSGLSATECNSAQNLNCVSEGPLEGCEGEAINTAIGCIPVGDTNEFIGFILRWAIGIGGGILSGLIVAYISRLIFSKRDNREYAQKILQANNEVLYAVRPGISEGTC